MDSTDTWERKWNQIKPRVDAKIIELHQISINIQKNPPEINVARNLKNKHYPQVEKLTNELKFLMTDSSQSLSDSVILVEHKYLEILNVWNYTDKALIKIFNAREAERLIKDYYFDQVDELRKAFEINATEIGSNFHESEHLRSRNTENYSNAKALWQTMYKSVDKAKELPIINPLCNRLDIEWEKLISALKERDKILKESSLFWKARDNFEWQCQTWIRHLTDYLRTSRNSASESIMPATIPEAEEYGKYAEQYGSMCYSQHALVAQNGKRLLSLLQDTSENDKRIRLDMTNSVEIICEALDHLLTIRDNVRDTAEFSRKLAAFCLDSEKVTKWIDELGRPFLEKSTTVGRSIERSKKLLERHLEFERVCQNTYSNVAKLLETGKSLAKQFKEYHSQIGGKCFQLQEITTLFDRDVTCRRDILESAVAFYTKVRDMWSIFEELRECPANDGNSHLASFEKNREDVQVAMQLTVSTGSNLVAKLRVRKTDVHAERHILDLVQSIRQASSSVNTKLACEKQRLDALSVKSNWRKDVQAECEKLQEWRLTKKRENLKDKCNFGPHITSLTNFVIKEQGRCFELARTGRELLLLLRDENSEEVEHLLNKLLTEQKAFESAAEDLKIYLENHYQTQESLKNALTTLNWICHAEQLFHSSPCQVDCQKSSEFTRDEFQQMKKVLFRTEKIMEDFELYQKGECLENSEVINRRQDVHTAWSRLQLLVEEREALIRKAISYHKTIRNVNDVLDGLENEWMNSSSFLKGLQSEGLVSDIEKHASKRKLILQATGLAHKHGHAFRKILDQNSPIQDLLSTQMANISSREKKVIECWSRKRKLLEERQTYILFEKICRAALTQTQELLQEPSEVAAKNMGPIKDKLNKIYDAAESFKTKNNSHINQMKLWIEKIKQKHIALYNHTGEDLSQLGNNFDNMEIMKTETEKDKRKSNLLTELLKIEKEYLKILNIALTVYLPAAKGKEAPPALRDEKICGEIFSNMKDLHSFHKKFYSSLAGSCEIEELSNCFVINSSIISDLYVDYCKGKEKSQKIIEEKSEGYFNQIQQKQNVEQPIQSCLIWPVQMMVKYVLLLKEILDCIGMSDVTTHKLKEAISVMEQVPAKANDAMHLALVQDPPRSELIKQGQVAINERKVLPTVQKLRDRHLFLFETALILCKKNENKKYVSRTTIPMSKLQWEKGNDHFAVWGNGTRLSLKPIDGATVEEWISQIRIVSSWSAHISSEANSCTMINNFNNSVPPPMAIFRSLPRHMSKITISDDLKSSTKNSLEV